MPPPGSEAPHDAPSSDSADSAGLPWTGRVLTGTGFDGDLGAADPSLLATLSDPQDETALMQAVAKSRLLVPVVAVAREPDEAEAPMAGQPARSSAADMTEKQASVTDMDGRSASATDMAVVTLTAPDGQRAFPVFSSLATLAAWDATARPSPVTGARAAQGAVTERCQVMLLDCGSGHERVLRPSMVWALAQEREWLPAHTDPFVAQALSQAAAFEQDVVDCVGEAEPAGGGILRVVLSLRPGLDAEQVQSLATRIGEQIATDGEARARIDGLSFTIRQA